MEAGLGAHDTYLLCALSAEETAVAPKNVSMKTDEENSRTNLDRGSKIRGTKEIRESSVNSAVVVKTTKDVAPAQKRGEGRRKLNLNLKRKNWRPFLKPPY